MSIDLKPLLLLDRMLPEQVVGQQDTTLLLRSRVLVALSLMYLGSTLFIAIAIAVVNLTGILTLWSAVLSSSIATILYFITLVYFRKSGNLFGSANLFMATLFFATIAFVFITGGLDSPVMMILMGVCVCAFLMLGRVAGMFWSFLVAAFYVGFYMLDRRGIATMQVVDDSLLDLLAFFSWVYAWAIMFGGMALFSGLARNLSETLNAERERLRVKATYDPLTGAYNRQYLQDRLVQHLAICHDPGRAFLFLDIEIVINSLISRDEEEGLLRRIIQALQNRYPGRIEPARSGGLTVMALIHDVQDVAAGEECIGAVYVALRNAVDETVADIIIGGVMVPGYVETEREIIIAGRRAVQEASSASKSYVLYTEDDRIHLEKWTPKNWVHRRYSEMVAH